MMYYLPYSQNSEYCLPYPQDSEYLSSEDQPTKVPYVAAAYPYHGDFRSFRVDNFERPPDELASLMQSWLYFGLIESVLGRRLDLEDLVRRESGKIDDPGTIDIRLERRLYELFKQTCESVHRLNSIQADEIWKRMKENVDFAEQQSWKFERVEAPVDSTLALVALSVQLLLSWLHIQFSHVKTYRGRFWRPLKEVSKNLTLKSQSADFTPLSTQLLMTRMRRNGWCPQRVKHLYLSFDYITVYYMSSLYHRAPRHLTHQECSDSVCVANNIPTHASHHESCQCPGECPSVGPTMSQVQEIISAGGIPLIRIKHMPGAQIKLEVVQCASHTRYVAISHVWADCQLGSRLNALPQCQLEHLDKVISNLPTQFGHGLWAFEYIHSLISKIAWYLDLTRFPTSGERLFWLDTLCIPYPVDQDQDQDPELEPEPNSERAEHIRLRTRAINMMDLIYAGAHQVLVLDSELQKVSGGTQEIRTVGEGLLHPCLVRLKVPEYRRLNDVLVHVLLCNWMGRAWTLQEGVLARDCVLQLKDSTLKIDHMDFRRYVSNYQANLRAPFCPKAVTCTGTNLWVSLTWWWALALFYRHKSVSSNGCARLKSYSKMVFWSIFGFFIALAAFPISYFRLFINVNPSFTNEWYPPETMEDILSHELREGIMSSLDSSICNPYPSRQKRHFQRVWNALSERTTSQRDDLNIILANLLGFNAGYMLQGKSPGEQMRAILFSQQSLPIELLFLNTPKYMAGKANPDRWIPTAPCPERLEEDTKMIYRYWGFHLDANWNSCFSVYMYRMNRDRWFRLHTSGISPTSGSSDSQAEDQFWVECLPVPRDEISETAETATCIILENKSGLIRGARLLFSEGFHSRDEIYLTYDCALRATKGRMPPATWLDERCGSGENRRPPISEIPIAYAEKVPMDYTLLLRHGNNSNQRLKYDRRPMNPRHKSMSESGLTFGIGSFYFVLNIIILNIIAQSIKRKVHRAVYYLLWVYGLIGIFIFACLVSECARYLFRVIGYKVWKASFMEDWKPDGWYAFWGKVIGIIPSFRPVERVENWN